MIDRDEWYGGGRKYQYSGSFTMPSFVNHRAVQVVPAIASGSVDFVLPDPKTHQPPISEGFMMVVVSRSTRTAVTMRVKTSEGTNVANLSESTLERAALLTLVDKSVAGGEWAVSTYDLDSP